MNFKIKKEILLENLNNVSKAMSNKNLIPILTGIKFELKIEGLYLTCSDDDITIESFIEKKQIEEINNTGGIVITGKYILDIIRKIPTDIINIETDGSKILLTTNNAEYNLNGMDINEYPSKNLTISKNPIKLPKKVLKNIINQTAFAISNQESRPILTGINFVIENDNLEVVATDSYRLSKKTVKLTEKIDNKINIVIPGRNLIELLKILTDEDENIEIHIFNNNILFKFDNILFQSRLLNGTFPNVSNLIPQEFNININLNLQDLYDAIDRASLLSDKENNIVKLEANYNELYIKANSLELGKIEERIFLNNQIEENIKISFNAKYMLDALKSLQSKEVNILLNGEVKPIILKDPTNDKLIQLILPVKTY